jgi:hypothetical protein
LSFGGDGFLLRYKTGLSDISDSEDKTNLKISWRGDKVRRLRAGNLIQRLKDSKIKSNPNICMINRHNFQFEI